MRFPFIKNVLSFFKSKDAKVEPLKDFYQRQCQGLQLTIDSQQSTIDGLRRDYNSLKVDNQRLQNENARLKKKLTECEAPPVEQPDKHNPTTESLLLQEEYDSFVDKVANATSDVLQFCCSMTTMDLTSSECIQYLENEVKQSMAGCGLEIIEIADSDFDPKRHRCIETIDCDTPELKNHIAEVIAPGFWYKNKCLIPQMVVVYK